MEDRFVKNVVSVGVPDHHLGEFLSANARGRIV